MPSKTQSTAPVADATYPADAIEAALDAWFSGPLKMDWREHHPGAIEQYRDGMSRALAAYESAMEAAGFVRVPVEPTEAMTLRGVHGCSCGAAHSGVPTYRAMIAARPSANKGERG